MAFSGSYGGQGQSPPKHSYTEGISVGFKSRSSRRSSGENGPEEKSVSVDNRQHTHRSASSKGGKRKLIGLESFSGRTTYFILAFVYITFGWSIYVTYKVIRTDKPQPFPTFPVDLFASAGVIPRDDLVAASNFAPYLDPYQNGTLVDFTAYVVAQDGDIEITQPDGGSYTALQLVSVVSSDKRISSFDLEGNYVDLEGIDLLGYQNIQLEMGSSACLRSRNCSDAQNWGLIADPTRTGLSTKIHVKERHPTNGLPTRIAWFIYSFHQYTFEPNPVDAAVWQIRYKAGGEIFTVNEAGNFGSCPAITQGMDITSLTSNSCMQLKVHWTLQTDWDTRYMYTAAMVVCSIAFGAYWYLLRRESLRTGIPYLHMQVWTLIFAAGVVLYQNPLQTVSEWVDYPRPNQVLLFIQDKVTLAGAVLVFFAIISTADAPKRMTCTRRQFYLYKVLYIAAWFIAITIEQFCYYPGVLQKGHIGSTGVLTQVESWDKQRQRWFVAASTVRGAMMISGFGFYLQFCGRSIEIYSQLPYGLTRAHQLGFRYFTSILGLIAFGYAVAFVYEVFNAMDQQELYRDYGKLTKQAIFLYQVFGQSLRSLFVVIQSMVFLLVVCPAFMSASYWGDDTGDIGYCIFENDVIRRTRLKRTSGRESSQGVKNAQQLKSSSVTSSILVIERARWAANLGKEAYRAYDEAELAARPPEPPDRLVDVGQFDCEMIAFLAEPSETSLHDTHAIICRHRPTRRLCVCFRGTFSQKQMITDIQTQYTKIRVDLLTTLKQYPHMVHDDHLPPYLRDYLPTNEERTRYNLPMSATNFVAGVLGLQEGSGKVGEGGAPPPSESKQGQVRGREASPSAEGRKGLHDLSPMHATSNEENAEGGQQERGGSSEGEQHEGGRSAGGGQREHGSGAITAIKDVAGAAGHVAGAAGHVAGQAAGHVGAVGEAVDAVTGSLSDVRTRVHYGFFSSYCTLREQVHEVVRRELTKEPGDLYVIGHSLGGAIASVCALDMAIYMLPSMNRVQEKRRALARAKRKAARVEEGREGTKRADDGDDDDDDDDDHEDDSSLKDINLVMYTYGQPRVGFPRYRAAFNLAVPNAWRIVNDGDIVPTVPPFWAGFVHVGHNAVIDTSGGGSVLVDPSMLEAHFKKKAGREVLAHLWPAYFKALDDCLDPIVDDDAVLRKIDECYQAEALKRKQEGGCCYRCCCCFCIRYRKWSHKSTTVTGEEGEDLQEEEVELELQQHQQ